MEQRVFGKTGLKVSVLGFGAGRIGGDELSEKEVETLLNAAADLGITLFDTARSYGKSEERIGRHLRRRRKDIILSTKVGYGIAGYDDWTFDCVKAGIDQALRLLQTDYLDIVHLHSCPRSTLEWGEPLRALEAAVAAGKVRAAGYSGENEPLEWAVSSGRFGAVEHSVSICDQRVIDDSLPREREKEMGVIAKRPLANVPWTFAECPVSHYAEEYWWRWRTMDVNARGIDWPEISLRFAAFTPGVHSCIVGTVSAEHLKANAKALARGPLPLDFVEEFRRAFKEHDPGWWTGQV